MRKIVSTILLLVMMFSISSCSGTNSLNSVTLKLEDTQRCEDCLIKFSSSTNMSVSYYITPEGFEWKRLEEKGYKMKITVSYDVYYKMENGIGHEHSGISKCFQS